MSILCSCYDNIFYYYSYRVFAYYLLGFYYYIIFEETYFIVNFFFEINWHFKMFSSLYFLPWFELQGGKESYLF